MPGSQALDLAPTTHLDLLHDRVDPDLDLDIAVAHGDVALVLQQARVDLLRNTETLKPLQHG